MTIPNVQGLSLNEAGMTLALTYVDLVKLMWPRVE